MPEWMQRKVGPYTVGQWLLIVAAGVALAWAFRRFQGRGGGGSGTAAFPGSYAGLEPTGRVGAATYGADGAARPDGEGLDAAGPSLIETNQQWLSYTSGKLQEAGWSAALVDQALRRYLAGYALTSEQYRVVEAALAVAGPPPEGAPALTVEPVPTSPAPGGGGAPEPTRDTLANYQKADQYHASSPALAEQRILAIYANRYPDGTRPSSTKLAAMVGNVMVQGWRYFDTIRADPARYLDGQPSQVQPHGTVPVPSTGTPTPTAPKPTGPNYLDALRPVLSAMGHNPGQVVDQPDAMKAAAWTRTSVGTRVDEADVPRILADYRRKVSV